MRHLRVVDWLLLGTLVPICAYAIVTSAGYGVVHGYDDLPFTASSAPAADAYPVIRSLQQDRNSDTLAVGDRIISIAGIDMRGLTTARSLMHIGALARQRATLPMVVERNGVPTAAALRLTPGLDWWLGLPFIVGLAGVGVFVLVRAAQWHWRGASTSRACSSPSAPAPRSTTRSARRRCSSPPPRSSGQRPSGW
ncbi:MAG: PDZ domain-containing protein [Candidatus Binatia bacterium]